jgi:hypothetical protein
MARIPSYLASLPGNAISDFLFFPFMTLSYRRRLGCMSNVSLDLDRGIGLCRVISMSLDDSERLGSTKFFYEGLGDVKSDAKANSLEPCLFGKVSLQYLKAVFSICHEWTGR